MTTFDRYVLGRFLHVFSACLIAALGLYVVIDAFTNVDNFAEATDGDGPAAMLCLMTEHYACHATLFADMAGPVLTVITTMVLLAMLQRHGEMHPIFAAGVPIYRICRPVVLGTVAINVALSLNQELVIPAIAVRLQTPIGKNHNEPQKVQQAVDFKNQLIINGHRLYRADRKLTEAEFVLPAGLLAQELTTIRADEAVFYGSRRHGQSGWLLRSAAPAYAELPLSAEGRRVVLRRPSGSELLVRTDVGPDQLLPKPVGERLVSSRELLRRIQNPSMGALTVRRQTLQLHTRMTRPLLNVLGVWLAVPLMVRKDSPGLVSSFAGCTLAMALIWSAQQLFLYLGRIDSVSAELSAWAAVILTGTLAAWATGWART